MFAVSSSRTMANAKPKPKVDDGVVVKTIEDLRRERRERIKAEHYAANQEYIEAQKAAKEKARLDAIAEAKRRQNEFLAEMALVGVVRRHTFHEIERRAIKLFGFSRAELCSHRRNKDVVFARQFVMYWACRLTSRSLPEIGRLMGGKDHTSILAGKRAYRAKRAKMNRNLREAR